MTEKRLKQKFENFENAFLELKDAINKKKYTKLETAGLIKTFEFTFELSWNLLGVKLEILGFNENSPRGIIKKAFEIEYIKNGESWLSMLESRNIMSHTYNEIKSAELIKIIKKDFFPLIFDLYNKIRKEIK